MPILLERRPAREENVISDKSRCVGLCKLSLGVCLGCGRTKDEITRWSSMTKEQRIEVNKRIQKNK